MFFSSWRFATIPGPCRGFRQMPSLNPPRVPDSLISANRSAVLTCLALLLLNAGCVRTLVNRRPDRYTIVRDQLVIHCDFEVPARHRLLDELTARREDLRRELAYASSEEPIHVYLFEDANRFKEFVGEEHPGFPNRRAFFVESDTRLEVYAHWGGYVGEDLRHEVTHAYLHSVLPNIPLWLDEGLAEYFEVPRGRHGLNRDHIVSILARDARPRRISRRPGHRERDSTGSRTSRDSNRWIRSRFCHRTIMPNAGLGSIFCWNRA